MDHETWMRYLIPTFQMEKLEVHEPNYDIIEVFIKYLSPREYPNILDLGAGAGIDMNLLSQKGYFVTGVGFGEKNCNYAKEKFGITIYQMDMHDLSFPDNTFDGVLSIQTFEHSLSPLIVASEISRVLRVGGRVFIDTPDPDDEAMWSSHHPSLLYPKQLERIFRIVGLETIINLSRKHRTQMIFEKVKK